MADEDAPEVYGFVPMPSRFIGDSALSDNGFRMLAELVRIADMNGECRPTNAELSGMTADRSHDSVSRGLVELVGLGLIEVVYGRTNRLRESIKILFPEFHLYAKTGIGAGCNYQKPGAPIRKTGDRCKNEVHLYAKTGIGALSEGAPIRKNRHRCIDPHVEDTHAGAHGRLRVEEEEKKEESPPTPLTGGVTASDEESPEPDFEGPRKPTERELRRLQELGDELFGEMTEFGAYACRLARLWEPAWVAEALKRAATSGKRIQPRYIEGILQGFQANDPPGPEKPVPFGKGRATAAGPAGPTNYLTGRSNQRYPGQDDNGRYEGQR